jgi:nitrate reductase delta subunit
MSGIAAPKVSPLRFRGTKNTPEHGEAVERVQLWTRRQFALPEDAPVLVSQLACSNENCPPIQTVVAFWTEAGDRHHFNVPKAIEAIAQTDVPREWIDDALFAGENGGASFCC